MASSAAGAAGAAGDLAKLRTRGRMAVDSAYEGVSVLGAGDS